jgi:hypothetical protein
MTFFRRPRLGACFPKTLGALMMKTQIIIAIVCLGLLIWVDPGSAQQIRTYSLTIGHHHKVALSADKVDEILAEASKVLKKCNVVLKRKGSVGTFASPNADGTISKASERDAVHRENFDIKIAPQLIDFCRVDQLGQVGCAWDPPRPPAKQIPQHRSIIVTTLTDTKRVGMILAHEFGHRTGLPHRSDTNALMACEVKVDGGQISPKECKCFRGGPGSCPDDPPEPAGKCGIGH